MKKPQWYLYIILLSIILFSLLFGKKIMYEHNTTLSNQKTEYISELSDDLVVVKDVKDQTAKTISIKKEQNKIWGDNIKKEQTVLDALKKAKQDEMNKYQELHSKWLLGLYLNPVVQLQFGKDGNMKNLAKSPDNNLPTDQIVNFNVDINNNKTNITIPFPNNPNIYQFNDNYISFPVVYMEQFTFMFYIFMKDDENEIAFAGLLNKRTLSQNPAIALNINIKGRNMFSFNRFNDTNQSSIDYKFPTSGWCHYTYSYHYDSEKDSSIVKIYNSGNIVNTQIYSGPIQSYLKSMYRYDTFLMGFLNGYIGYFNYFAFELSDTIIKRFINTNPKPIEPSKINTDWK